MKGEGGALRPSTCFRHLLKISIGNPYLQIHSHMKKKKQFYSLSEHIKIWVWNRPCMRGFRGCAKERTELRVCIGREGEGSRKKYVLLIQDLPTSSFLRMSKLVWGRVMFFPVQNMCMPSSVGNIWKSELCNERVQLLYVQEVLTHFISLIYEYDQDFLDIQ